MRSFKQYLAESERALSGPVTEDLIDLQINEVFCIESEILEHDDVSVTILADDEAMNILDSLGMLVDEAESSKLSTLDKSDITYDLGDGYYVASFDVGDGDRNAVQREVYKLENPAAMDNRTIAGWRAVDFISLPASTTKDAVRAAGEKIKADDMQKNQPVSPMAEQEVDEAEYQGRQVKLGKPMAGDVKKYKVYVRNPKTGKIKKVNFGDKGMEIKRDNPARRKNFRARHNCSQKKDRTKAGYWSCRMWSRKPVSKIVRGK